MIDDGVPSRGHRENIFLDCYTMMGCYSGEHKAYSTCCVVNYGEGFAAPGQVSIQEQMQAFMNEPVDFDMPEGAGGWSQGCSCSVSGNTVTKSTTRTVNMSDGSTKVLTDVQVRTCT